ncbi:hypothetical protein DTL42_22460 [Bremerella cremea]|uniref:Zinc ribbon domain-containing protein n=1 Tax=Bremerella cremea TaxID=1031537 RepID=A0A368KP76_9BACT|nr:hypothetical protein [Bremerella cremea]RCS41330.1 hypothetical protein DTL42_22460 [Bremerella cremea]
MSDLLEKCTVCGGLIDEEDLFCGNCGTEAPLRQAAHTPSTTISTHSFTCAGCGAAMSYSAEVRALRCPFCGSTKLEKGEDHKIIAPSKVLPFHIHEEDARRIMREAIGKGFWRPPDLSERAVIRNMVPVYVPYWVFAAEVFTNWTADTSQTPYGASGDWYPLSGEHRARYEGVLVGASGALTPNETSQLCPFDMDQAVSPEEVDLDNFTVEQFNVARKYARPMALAGLEALERRAVDAKFVPPRSRNVQANLRVQNMSSDPMLLPVWIMAYQYQEQTYRFLINGQTGKSTGQGPISYQRFVKVVGIVVAVAVGIGILAAMCGGLGNLLAH